MKLELAMSLEHSLVVHFNPQQLILICIIGPIILAVLGLFLLRKVIPPDELKQYHDIAGPFLNTIVNRDFRFTGLIAIDPDACSRLIMK